MTLHGFLKLFVGQASGPSRSRMQFVASQTSTEYEMMAAGAERRFDTLHVPEMNSGRLGQR